MIHDVHADTASIYVATPADLNLRARRSYVYTYLGPPITSVCVVCAGVRGVHSTCIVYVYVPFLVVLFVISACKGHRI